MMEMLIVLMIISLLVSIAIPAYSKYRDGRTGNIMASQIRLACQAYELYKMEQGEWPPNAYPGDVPTEMLPYYEAMNFSKAGINWAEDTVVGGTWDWDGNCQGLTAAVAVPYCTARSSMEHVDRILDDGDLNTGRFRYYRSQYTYILEE